MANARAKEYAELVLGKFWKAGLFPVDSVAIASNMGLAVRELKLPEGVSGALIKDKGEFPVIFINETDHQRRKSFTCAHEIGHYVDHILKGDMTDEYECVDLRHEIESAKGTDSEEVFANEFAANLLMPEAEVRKFKKLNTPLSLMKDYFGVSQRALHFRLKNLGLLDIPAHE